MAREHANPTSAQAKPTLNSTGKVQTGTPTSALLQRLEAAPASIRPADVLQLQRSIGNRATGLLLQAKLKLGPAGDQYEQEADRVAKQVVHTSRQPAIQREDGEDETLQASRYADSISGLQRSDKPLVDGISRVRRAFVAPPKMPQVQREEMEDELQAAPNHGMESGNVDTDVAQSIQRAKGGGQPLHDGVRSSMERGFGADFGGVRVHTGGQADALNRSLNAKAFTTGSDTFFNKGQYNPGSTGGQELIAHELTHTVQQTRYNAPSGDGVSSGLQRSPTEGTIQRTMQGTYASLVSQGGGISHKARAKKVFTLGFGKSTYDYLLDAVNSYEAAEKKRKQSTSWFLTRLRAIVQLCQQWLMDSTHKNEQSSQDKGALARANAVNMVLLRAQNEMLTLGGSDSEDERDEIIFSGTKIENLFDESDFEETKNETPLDLSGKIEIISTSTMASKYDFGFVAEGGKETEREAIFTKFVDNCKLAGLPVEDVLMAARAILGKWGGWDHPAVGDFDFAYVDKFKDKLQDEVKGATLPVIKACFTMNPNLELLRSFAIDMEPVEIEEEFEIENEKEFVWEVASSFDNKGDKDAFIKFWNTSRSATQRQIYNLVSTEDGMKSLSTMGYLVEALDKKHRYDLNSHVESWANSSTTTDFFIWLESQLSAKEKSSVRYYNEEDRKEFVITVDSVLTRANEKPLSGDNIFVMSKQNVLYAANKETSGSVRLHHSSFLSGQAVKAAGHLYTNGSGKLYKIDNSSGHYGPTNVHLAQALAVFKKQGVDLTQVSVSSYKGGTVDAEEFLSSYL